MAHQMNSYWNPILETMPREKLRQLQLGKFKRVVEYAYENSPFYRRLYSAAGMEPGDIKTFEDIAKVPENGQGRLRRCRRTRPFLTATSSPSR